MPVPTVTVANPNGLRTTHPGAGTSFAIDGGGASGFSEIVPGSITGVSNHQSLLQVAQVVMTTANVTGMFATPFVLIAAPGAGKSIVVDYVLQRLTVGTQFGGGGVVTIGYNGGAAVVNTVAAAVINNASSADTLIVTGASNITATQNAAIQITNATGAFTGGANSTLTYFIWYSVV